MKQNEPIDFIVIDDDMLNNLVSRKVIQLSAPGSEIRTFTDAAEGIIYIAQNYSDTDSSRAILFLNVNMPFLSGWDVLEKLDELPATVKSKIKIYMLSSSAFTEDITKASTYSIVSGYLDKPLSQTKFTNILTDMK